MRFERMIRLTMLAGAAWAMPGAAQAVAIGVPAGQSAPQSADDYRWIDQADALWDAIGDAPPDFAFAFEGREPWAWQTASGYTIIVEDAGEQGIRSYYFAPGDSSPFLAVEPGMSFAFEGGRLAMVYDADGEAAPRAEFDEYDDAAHDLYARGRRLFQALAGRDYRPVDADAWIDASPYIFGFIQLWDSGRSRYPGWGRYHDRNDAEAWRRRFEDERRRRREQALRFSHWRQGGFQGPPPGHYHAPGQPGRPGTGRPPQPGSSWSHGPGNGGRPPQPGRPGRPGGPGTNPPPQPGTPPVTEPGIETDSSPRPPFTRPPSRPDGSPGWRRGRPTMPPAPPGTVPDAGTPVTPVPQPGTRPTRPWGNGGWGTRPTPAPAPTPPVTGTAPMPPSSGEVSPAPRPRPGGWGSRPTPAPAPTPPVVGTAPPPPVNVEAPRPRPEGGWRPRPSAPEGSPPPVFRPRPTPQPGATPPPPRPSYTPPAPSAAPSPPPSRPSYTPPPRSAPPPRSSPPPAASRPSPPKVQIDNLKAD